MNRAVLNLLLLLVVIGLGVAAFLAHKKQTAPKAKLLAIEAAKITSAEIAWPGAPLIRLAKTGGEWTMSAPVAARVDGYEILGVTNLAGTEVQETLTPEGLNLKDIGLDPPDHSVTLNGTRIDFGATEPLNFRRYVRIAKQVMLIDDPVSAALDKDYNDLVSKQLFAPVDEIIALELPGGLSFAKAADGKWSAATASPAATPEAIAALVQAWKTAKSQYNEMAPTASAGERVKLGLKDGKSLEFVVAATDPQLTLYSETLKLRLVLSKELVAKLLKLPEPVQPVAATAPGAAPALPTGSPKPSAPPATPQH